MSSVQADSFFVFRVIFKRGNEARTVVSHNEKEKQIDKARNKSRCGKDYYIECRTADGKRNAHRRKRKKNQDEMRYFGFARLDNDIFYHALYIEPIGRV